MLLPPILSSRIPGMVLPPEFFLGRQYPIRFCKKIKQGCHHPCFIWRRVRDSNPRSLSGHSISSAASHWQIGAGGGQNGPVCPRFFSVVGRISGRMQKFPRWYKSFCDARFASVLHAFLEKCKMGCKIRGSLPSRMETGLARICLQTDPGRCEI